MDITLPPRWFFFTILFTLSVCYTVCGLFFFNNAADIKPKDVLVFVGESLELTCTTKVNVSIEEVYFNIVSGESSWRVPRRSHVIRNNRTVSTTIKIVEAFTQYRYTTVECRNGNNSFLRSTFIFVERPIRNITNFTDYYLYEDHYNMSWSLGQRYLAPEDIGVDVGWSRTPLTGKPRSELYNCTRSTKEACIINYRDVSALGQIYFLYIRITVYSLSLKKRPGLENFTPLFSTNATSTYRMYTYNSTKSGPPVNVTVDRDRSNSTCVGVTWADPVYLKNSYYESAVFYYNLKYSPSNQQESFILDTGYYNSKSLPITICNLRPFTNYLLGVQVRRETKQPWSDWSTMSTQTDEDIPLTGPSTMSTSFFSSDCYDGTRDVYVFWLKPNISTLQGQLTRFEVNVIPVAGHPPYNVSKTSSYCKITALDCAMEYNISIYSATRVGRSLIPSIVSIPPTNKDLITDGLGVKVEEFQKTSLTTSPRTLSVTWTPLNQVDATLVFYRCAKNGDSAICQDGYNYTEVDAAKGQLYLYNITAKDDLIGYALRLASDQTNGISQIKCVYNRKARPGKPLGLHVTTLEDYGSLAIAWDSDPCNKQTKVLVAYYTIYVCAESTLTSIDSCLQQNVSNTTNSWTVQALEDNKDYNVSIRATSAFNLPGELSDFKVGRTSFKISGNIIVVMVLSTVFFIGILGCVIWFIKKCTKSMKKIRSYSDDFHQDTKSEVKEIKNALQYIDLNDSVTESGLGTDISTDSAQDEQLGDIRVVLAPTNLSSPKTNTTLTEDIGARGTLSTSVTSDEGGEPPAFYSRLTCRPEHETGASVCVDASTGRSSNDIVAAPTALDAVVSEGNAQNFEKVNTAICEYVVCDNAGSPVQTGKEFQHGPESSDERSDSLVPQNVREYVAFGEVGTSSSSTNDTTSGHVNIEENCLGVSVEVEVSGLSDLDNGNLSSENHFNAKEYLTIPKPYEEFANWCNSGNVSDHSVVEELASKAPCKDNPFSMEQMSTDCNHGENNEDDIGALHCIESVQNMEGHEKLTLKLDSELGAEQSKSIPGSQGETNYVCSGDYLHTVNISDTSGDGTCCTNDSNIGQCIKQSNSTNSGYLPLHSMC